MTTVYLSFADIAKLHNKGSVSPIGELSLRSKSYEIDPATYTKTGVNEVVLYNFFSTKDNTQTQLPQTLAEKQIDISNWLYQQALNGNLTDNKFDCQNLLVSTFTSGVEFEAVGDMATNGTYWLPSVVRGYHLVQTDPKDATKIDKQQFYLWFGDEYFQEQYLRSTYGIVHPVPLTEIDALYEMTYIQLAQRLETETPDVVNERETQVSDGSPYTQRSILGYNVYDLINVPSFVKAYWRILTRGNYDEDAVMEQIRQEILANSKYTEAQWGEKIPDLFNPNEMYGIIRFDRLGLKNKTDNTSTLSPIIDVETEMKFVNIYLTPFMSANHVIKSTQSMPSLYKSMQYTMTAKTNNRAGYQKMSSFLPDYQLIDSKDSDFGHMSLSTRQFLLQIENLLAAAEVVTEFSIPPAGITVVKRFDKLWVTKKINEVKYMVLLRAQMVDDGLLAA